MWGRMPCVRVGLRVLIGTGPDDEAWAARSHHRARHVLGECRDCWCVEKLPRAEGCGRGSSGVLAVKIFACLRYGADAGWIEGENA